MELKEKEDKSSTAESSFYPERYKATINIVLITGKTLLILILSRRGWVLLSYSRSHSDEEAGY